MFFSEYFQNYDISKTINNFYKNIRIYLWTIVAYLSFGTVTSIIYSGIFSLHIIRPFILPFMGNYKKIVEQFDINSKNIYSILSHIESEIIKKHNYQLQRMVSLLEIDQKLIHSSSMVSFPQELPSQIYKTKRKVCILIHGLYDSGLSMMTSFYPFLKSEYEIHSLDLPFISLSEFNDKQDKEMILSYSSKDILLFYHKFIITYIEKIILKDNTINKSDIEINIIGHSFGGFIASTLPQIDIKKQKIIDKIILVNPIGLFSLYSIYGNCFSNFFQKGYLPCIMKYFLDYDLFYTLISLHDIEDLQDLNTMYYMFHLCHSSESAKIIRKFLTQKHIWVKWNYPSFSHLLQSSMKFAFVFGKKDIIVSKYQSLFIRHICENDIPCGLVHFAGHSPHVDQPESFGKILNYSLENSRASTKELQILGKKIEQNKNISDNFYSTYSFYDTYVSMMKQFRFIHDLFYRKEE